MHLLQVFSRLLHYPDASLVEHRDTLLAAIAASDLTDAHKASVSGFIQNRTGGDLMDWEEEYDGLFERGRSLGLWLFEHVHGESRDRGQAMVDLLNQYRQAGLEIDDNELPDYIPLFLEFLATQGDDNARSWLSEVEHILALLCGRLEKRESDYAVVLQALIAWGGVEKALTAVASQLASEARDDTPAALDKEWEEQAVTFDADSVDAACPTARNRPSESQRKDQMIPVNWTGFEVPAAPSSNRGMLS